MWTYSVDAIAGHAFDAPATQKISGFTIGDRHYSNKYLLYNGHMAIDNGTLNIAGIDIDGNVINASTVVVNGDTVISNTQLVYTFGIPAAEPGAVLARPGDKVTVDNVDINLQSPMPTVTVLEGVRPEGRLELAHIAKYNEVDDTYELEEVNVLPSSNYNDIQLEYSTVLNTQSSEYQQAGNWNGVYLAIQGVVALLWAMILPRFSNRRLGYSVSLLIGAIGFISSWFLNSQWLLTISFGLMGVAWAAMLAMPFTILTNALKGSNIGAYLGLFNCTICIPQIIAALLGGTILSFFPLMSNGVPMTAMMLVTSGILLAIASLFVWNVTETSGLKNE
ncbi:MAG: MFS transporter [Muribaculaceae bacterium]|nr:MFS transporter [Muribaculaceae bacterium]